MKVLVYGIHTNDVLEIGEREIFHYGELSPEYVAFLEQEFETDELDDFFVTNEQAVAMHEAFLATQERRPLNDEACALDDAVLAYRCNVIDLVIDVAQDPYMVV